MKPDPLPLPDEYVADLKELGTTSLADIVGDISKPLLLEVLQEKLWAFLIEQHALKLSSDKDGGIKRTKAKT